MTWFFNKKKKLEEEKKKLEKEKRRKLKLRLNYLFKKISNNFKSKITPRKIISKEKGKDNSDGEDFKWKFVDNDSFFDFLNVDFPILSKYDKTFDVEVFYPIEYCNKCKRKFKESKLLKIWYQFSKQIKRFRGFSQEDEEGFIFLCPYCASPLGIKRIDGRNIISSKGF